VVAIALDKFSGLVASIYDTAHDQSRWETTLEQLAAGFGATCGALLVAQPETRQLNVKSVGADPAIMKSYNAYYGRLDPVADALQHTAAGAITSGIEVITPQQQLRAEFYVDWAFPNHLGDGLFATLTREGTDVSWLSIAAPLQSEPFGTPERRKLFRLLMPHLQNVMRVQWRLGALALERDYALDALDRLTHGAALARRGGTVLFANSALIAIATSTDGLALGGAGLRAMRPSEDGALRLLINRASDGPEPRCGGSMTISRPSGRRSFAIHVLPLNSRATAAGHASGLRAGGGGRSGART
jgi:hypothetical protein